MCRRMPPRASGGSVPTRHASRCRRRHRRTIRSMPRGSACGWRRWAAALDDLPGQAKRFARWKARNDAALARDRQARDAAMAQGKHGASAVPFRRLSPLRRGRPPGGRLSRYDPDRQASQQHPRGRRDPGACPCAGRLRAGSSAPRHVLTARRAGREKRRIDGRRGFFRRLGGDLCCQKIPLPIRWRSRPKLPARGDEAHSSALGISERPT